MEKIPVSAINKLRIQTFAGKILQRYFLWINRLTNSPDSNEHWSNAISWYSPNGFKSYWETLDEVRKYQYRVTTGNENLSLIAFALDYVSKHVGSSDLFGLSIGCGESGPEMVAWETGLFSSFEVMDIAEGLLDRQREKAKKRGYCQISYVPANLNKVVLEENKYDFIWALGTIHHIEELEHFIAQIKKSLKPHGIIAMREYVGPKYLQFTKDQLVMADAMLQAIPKKYRRFWNLRTKTHNPQVDKEYLLRNDPSEAVRSDEILPIIFNELKVIHFAKTGGTLLHPLLAGIAVNFELIPGGREILLSLIAEEERLVRECIIPSDYMFALAKK